MLLFSRGEAVRGLVRNRVVSLVGNRVISLAASPLAPQIPPATQAK